MNSILITGGAGFVGSQLALYYREKYPSCRIVAFDNFHRSGSESNGSLFKQKRIELVHGDVRVQSDLEDLQSNFDLLIEASAEPSVLAGVDGRPDYVIQTNLYGAINCLNWARHRAGATIFLSTSRAHSMPNLCNLKLDVQETRFDIAAEQSLVGVSHAGISEEFSTQGPRSFYGASKLAAEVMIDEYVALYDMNVVTNRCSVICGPGQFGKASQGIFTLWMANHFFGRPLRYTGYGGQGKQVRDLLHPKDLFNLIERQIQKVENIKGRSFNVGGGRGNSTSMLEFTHLCEKVIEKSTEIESVADTTLVDVPLYITDAAKAQNEFAWEPEIGLEQIVRESVEWIDRKQNQLKEIII